MQGPRDQGGVCLTVSKTLGAWKECAQLVRSGGGGWLLAAVGKRSEGPFPRATHLALVYRRVGPSTRHSNTVRRAVHIALHFVLPCVCCCVISVSVVPLVDTW
ncbi:hypothetical protein J6590_027145 [Homalodisca vitripennis]|nr:hypothetical protein J6590_027145 [Homalodisca vitripennis]